MLLQPQFGGQESGDREEGGSAAADEESGCVGVGSTAVPGTTGSDCDDSD